MSKVAVTFRIEPKEGVEINKIKEELNKLNPQDVKEIPIAFGIKHLEVLFLTHEKPDDIENALKNIDGVAHVSCEKVTLV